MLIFRIFSALGFVLSIADFIGSVSSSPICKTDGCALVNSITPYGSLPFTITGIILFSLLIVLSFYKKAEFLLDYVLALALAMEGVLLGFQAFFLNSFCRVCVGIALIIGALIVIRIYRNKKNNIFIFAFASTLFIVLFSISAFLFNPIWNPPKGQTLIYSKNCSHCEGLLVQIKKNQLKIRKVPLKRAKDFLIANGIEIVPVLVVNNSYGERIIKGKKNIENVLFPLTGIENKIKGFINGQKNDQKKSDDDSSGSCNFVKKTCE